MKRVVISLCILFFFSAQALTAEEQFIYKRISNQEGLTSTVNCIFNDHEGDVLLGTPKGLYTFNGHTLSRHNDPLFQDLTIFEIEEDRDGGIWILTDNWIMRRRQDEKQFSHLKAESFCEQAPFYCHFHDEDGIWFGSQGSIYRYTYEDDRFFLFCYLEEDKHFICTHMTLLDDSTLLCCSNNGSILVDIDTKESSREESGKFNGLSGMMTDSKGRLWTALYNKGIRVYGKDGSLIKTYTTENSALSNSLVICFTEKDSKIWAGTDGGGINIIDPESGEIKVISHISGDSSSFPAHSIKSIYTDSFGNIWAGSTRDGVIRISQSGMKTYSDSHIGLSSGLSNPSVLCLFQEKDSGYIWIGTDGEGLNRFDPVTNRFTHYRSTLKTKIVSVAYYSETELALSVYAEGIWLFNKETGSVRPLAVDDDEINYFMKYTGRSLILANGNDGNMYFLSNMVRRFDKETGSCHKIATQEGINTFGNIFAIGNSDESLYLHDLNSIYRIDKDELNKVGGLEGYIIHSGYLGDDGDIWLATDKGLCRFNEHSGELSFIGTNLFSNASSVVWDGNSRVWIGTDNYLFAYLTDQSSFAMFGESDGAPYNEYLAKPRLLSNNGDVYLGGVQGLLSIDADYTIDASETPFIRLQSLSADRSRIYADDRGIYEIPRNSKLMSINVSTKETDIFRQKMFRFTFAGAGREYELMSPTLEIQDLPKPGRYDIKVSCTKRDGNWTEPVTVMTLRIPQPWYRSGWFMGLCLLLMTIITGSIVTVMMNRRRSRLQLALKEQEQMVYEEKVKMLINISHELRTPLTLVMAPLKRLISETDESSSASITLKRIYRQSVRMKNLLNMVLDLRKMEVGQNRLKLEDMNFNMWINETTHDIITEGQAEGIEFVMDLSENVGHVMFDRQKCDAVMMNILMNAIKHSISGNVITIRSEMSGTGMVRVSISDEGPGLGEIDPDKMFTRFYQSNNEQYGSGIGLSYSKILVELHGGNIGMYNNSDKGATFWWEIPLNPGAEAAENVPAKAYLNEILGEEVTSEVTAEGNHSFSTASMTLMLVDDNQDLLDFLKESLCTEFAEIILSTSGNKALKTMNSGKLPDIVVSDVNMPDGNGFRLCSTIKNSERLQHIPVILLTARGEQQSQSDSYRVGADAFLAKPFEMETLLELMRGILRRKEDTRRMYLDTDEDVTSSYGSQEEGFIIQLNRIISKHIDDPDLDQQIICREIGLSRAALFNRMKSITGTGTKEYITRIRLEKAKTLIESTQLTIAEISEKTGFSSQSYFSTAFKNFTGMTPSQYKKAVLDKD